jgi:lipopolysaccharide transport system permease protein
MKGLSELPVRVYSAKKAQASVAFSFVQAVLEVWDTREIVWQLFVRDFTNQFRQKILGYFWAFLSPLIGVASFIFLHYTGVLNPGELTIPYPLYLFVGMTLWGMLMGVVTIVSGGLLAHGDLVLRTNIPKIALALAGMANFVYLQLVNLIILLIILVAFGIAPSWGALAFPVLVLPLVAIGLGVGLILAAVGALARDVTGMVTTVLGLGMYLTPVIYVPNFENPYLQAIINFNPLTYLIDEPRSLFFSGVDRKSVV